MDNNVRDIRVGDIVDLYCVDCQKWTKQKYEGALLDKSQRFLCKNCGCENIIEKHEQR